MATIIVNGKKYHRSGHDLIECKAPKDSEDCPVCNVEKEKEIKAWLAMCKTACLLCHEKPPCFICMKAQCKDWHADKKYLEEVGSHHGCRKLSLSSYCTEFFCRYGLRGWWKKNWRGINKPLVLKIKAKMHKRKIAELSTAKSKEKRRANKETKKPTNRKALVKKHSVAKVVRRPTRNKSSVESRHRNVHPRVRIPQSRKSHP